MLESNNSFIPEWLDQILARGSFSFSTESINQDLPHLSEIAVKRALNRLSTKGRILPIFRGYYLIIPPQYRSIGTLPPTLFLDALMQHLHRPYYLGLLNAAAFHGATHQQPQEFFVMTGFPVLRPTLKKGLKINYISIRNIPSSLIEMRNTEAGYINISNAALSACDLVQFEKRIGGLNRASLVLSELSEVLKPSDLTPELLLHVPVSTLQRLGYLLEKVCLNQELASALYGKMKTANLHFHRTLLKASGNFPGLFCDKQWNVVVNTEIEADE